MFIYKTTVLQGSGFLESSDVCNNNKQSGG